MKKDMCIGTEMDGESTMKQTSFLVFRQESGHRKTVLFLPKLYRALLDRTALRNGSKANRFSELSNCHETNLSDMRVAYFFS